MAKYQGFLSVSFEKKEVLAYATLDYFRGSIVKANVRRIQQAHPGKPGYCFLRQLSAANKKEEENRKCTQINANEDELTTDSSRLLPLIGMRRARENRGFIERAILPVPARQEDREDYKTSYDVRSIGIRVTADFTDGADRERPQIWQSQNGE